MREYGEEAVLTEKTKRKDGAWHFGFSLTGKNLLPGWLDRHATAEDCGPWIKLLQLIRSKMGLNG